MRGRPSKPRAVGNLDLLKQAARSTDRGTADVDAKTVESAAAVIASRLDDQHILLRSELGDIPRSFASVFDLSEPVVVVIRRTDIHRCYGTVIVVTRAAYRSQTMRSPPRVSDGVSKIVIRIGYDWTTKAQAQDP